MMTPDHPDAFLDYPPVDQTNWPEGATLCPICQGHGGWNLAVNCYRSRDDPQNAHFRTMCGACWGYGYLQPGQTCPHEWQHDRTIGRCLHVWKCTKCGAEREVDSSD